MMHPCAVCPNRNDPGRIVRGSGPSPCRTAWIGEGPGREEHLRGRVFCGQTGMEYDNYVGMQAAMPRSQIYTTNVYKCFKDGDNPNPAEARVCAEHHLRHELEQVQPEFLITMGSISNAALVPEVSLDIHHGLVALPRTIYGREYTVIPILHPAAGLHDSRMMDQILGDFQAVRRLIRGEVLLPVDHFAGEERYEVWEPRQHDRHANVPLGGVMGIDTELTAGAGHPKSRPWMMQFSTEYGVGYAVMADRADQIEDFRKLLRAHLRAGGLVVFHNAMFDVPVCASMGIDFPLRSDGAPCWIDTMVMAYHRNTDQRLKVLAYRLCGMEMTEYADLVNPYSERDAVLYLEEAVNLVRSWRQDDLRDLAEYVTRAYEDSRNLPDPEPVQSVYKTGKRKGQSYARKPPRVGGRIRKLLDVIHTHDEPWKRWEDIRQDPQLGGLSQRIGHPPPDMFRLWDSKINRIVNDFYREGRNTDMWARWENLPGEIREAAEAVSGDLPHKSLLSAPFDEALHYAARDPDSTIRVFTELMKDVRKIADADVDHY